MYEPCVFGAPSNIKYKIGRLLGAGAFGRVNRAWRIIDNTVVVIKSIKLRKIRQFSEPGVPAEVGFLQTLAETPGVIRLIDSFVMEPNYFIVFSHHYGHIDLYTFLSRTTGLTEKTAHDIFVQIFLIIVSLRDKRILHRDIKDDNFLIDVHTQEVCIIDLGNAAIYVDEEYTTYGGALEWAPPEWVAERRFTAEGLNTWQLGIMAYTLLCGIPPYNTAAAIVGVGGVWATRSRFTRATECFVSTLLQKNPMERIKLDEIATHDWVHHKF